MRLNILVLLSSIGAASARYAANLNYDSPSAHHPFLGISLYKVVRRHDQTIRSIDASSLNFTHGVASGDPYANSVILWTRCSPEYDNDKSNSKTNNPGAIGALITDELDSYGLRNGAIVQS